MAKHASFKLMIFSAMALSSNAAIAQEAVSDDLEPSEFANMFEPYAPLPPDPEPAGQAVDLDLIQTPVEPELATTSIASGNASFYGRRFHGRRTANGERFDMHAMTAAHRTLPFGSLVEVTNPRNGKSVVVRINDRGPFHGNRVIDLSRAAAAEIGLIRRGHGPVELALVN